MKLRECLSTFVVAAICIVTAGCEVGRVDQAMDRVDKEAGKADALTAALRNKPTANQNSVVFSDEQWVSTKPLVMKRGLPAAFDCMLGYNESKTLQQFGEWVSGQCGVAVRVTPDALDNGASFLRASKGAAAAGPAPVIPQSESISDLFPGGSGSTAYSGRSGGSPMARAVRYEGPLSGLLDTVTGSLGLSWNYEPGVGAIKIFYLETRTFSVYAFNKETGFASVVKSGMTSSTGNTGGSGSGSSGVSGDSGSTQTTTIDMKSSIVHDIEANVRSMLTLDRMAYSRTTGIISITDRPDVLDRVQVYLDAENASITKQILFNIEIVSVALSDRDQYGIDWDLVYKSSSVGGGLKNTGAGIADNAAKGSINIIDAGSPWAGSKLLVQALSEQGKVSSRSAPSVTTLNLQAAPVQIGNVKGYLASSETTNSANVGSSTALIPGSITSGFNMSLLPFVMPDNKLLLQLAINMSTNPTFETIKSGESMIQNPDYSLQIFNQSVKLRSGQTLVLSGFDQTTDNANKSGTGTASNFLFGGGGSRESKRDVIVLMITPIILE